MIDRESSEETAERAPDGDGATDPTNPCANTNELTPEEQMAQYEESLKDDDWGHQPC